MTLLLKKQQPKPSNHSETVALPLNYSDIGLSEKLNIALLTATSASTGVPGVVLHDRAMDSSIVEDEDNEVTHEVFFGENIRRVINVLFK
jgi:hypothetical protein